VCCDPTVADTAEIASTNTLLPPPDENGSDNRDGCE
jgi:hypothetical protein